VYLFAFNTKEKMGYASEPEEERPFLRDNSSGKTRSNESPAPESNLNFIDLPSFFVLWLPVLCPKK
jgi:hypothetical protein